MSLKITGKVLFLWQMFYIFGKEWFERGSKIPVSDHCDCFGSGALWWHSHVATGQCDCDRHTPTGHILILCWKESNSCNNWGGKVWDWTEGFQGFIHNDLLNAKAIPRQGWNKTFLYESPQSRLSDASALRWRARSAYAHVRTSLSRFKTTCAHSFA